MATTKQTTKEDVSNGKSAPTLGNLYNEGIQEIVKLAEDDNYARKIDNGALKEARGKDTWQVHSQLQAVSRLNQNLGTHVGTIEAHLNDLDGHLDAATGLLTKLTNQTQKALLEATAASQKGLDKALSTSTTELAESITSAQTAINERLDAVHKSVKGALQEVVRANAGSEESIRRQTESFSKAVETLLNDVRGDLDAKIAEFRDDATRLIDKRFNQSDVSFAAVRADQEVIKALLTDIIKDRLGRAEPRVR